MEGAPVNLCRGPSPEGLVWPLIVVKFKVCPEPLYQLRTVPLPLTILPELKGQLEKIKALHERDIAEGYAGVFLFDALERNYKNAAREFIWQWFFPAKILTLVPETMECRR